MTAGGVAARLLLLGGVAVLAGVPVTAAPTGPVAWLAGAGGLLGAAGVLGARPALGAAAGAVATLAYAAGLATTGPPPGLLAPVGLGLAALVVVQGSAALARVRGAEVRRPAGRRQAARWAALGGASVAVALGLDALAGLVWLPASAAARAALAAAGGLAAVLGVVGLLRRRTGGTGSPW